MINLCDDVIVRATWHDDLTHCACDDIIACVQNFVTVFIKFFHISLNCMHLFALLIAWARQSVQP